MVKISALNLYLTRRYLDFKFCDVTEMVQKSGFLPTIYDSQTLHRSTDSFSEHHYATFEQSYKKKKSTQQLFSKQFFVLNDVQQKIFFYWKKISIFLFLRAFQRNIILMATLDLFELDENDKGLT